MKHVCVELSLVAVLLAAVAVPVAGNGAKASGKAAPVVVAGGMPVPWCDGKKCTVVNAGAAPNSSVFS